jgi:FSR family fosmidomycin resistance protein-like MFS transporter
MLNDVNQGAIPALLPFLVTQRDLSYTAASGLVLTATVISAIIQPLLGLYSDRHPIPWLMPLGMLLGGLGIALSGLPSDYGWIVVAMFISGSGVAAFHPEGYRFANYVSREQRASGMSIFSVGGQLGFAIGPLLMTAAILALGLRGTLVMLIPAAIYTLVLWFELPRLSQFREDHHASIAAQPADETNWSAFIRLTIVIVLRSILYYGLIAFLPLYLIKIRELSIPEANGALTILAISGATGTLVLGNIADRFGRKRVLLTSLALMTALITLLLYVDKSFLPILLVFVGIAVISVSTVTIVMGQEYAAMNLGVATGITTGLAIGLGGLGSPILGLVADLYGLNWVVVILAALPLAALALAVTLPAKNK